LPALSSSSSLQLPLGPVVKCARSLRASHS